MTRISDVVDMTFGFAFKSAEFSDEPTDVRLLRGDNIAQGRLRWGGAKRFPKIRVGKVERYQLAVGDVVIAMDRPWIEAGLKYSVVREEDVPSLLVQRVARLRTKSESLDQGFLGAVIGSAAFTNYVIGVQTGSAVPHISGGQIGDFEFELPTVGEQRAIAATLGALDDKIDSNRRAVTIAEQLGDALFAAAASESRLLSDVADITMGSSPKGADLNEDGDGLPFYQGTRDFGVRFPSLRVWTTAPVRTAAKSDTLMSVRAPVGELNRASADCCIGRGVAAIHSDTHPSTLYYAMRSSSSAWDKFQGEGTVFASVNKTDVHGAEIRWVGDGALLELEDKLRAIDARIESLESETQRLTALRDALLPELLSGRMRVPAEGVAA